MEPNAKSILSTTFHLGTFQVPIRLYKTTDTLGLSGRLFHDGCDGKIRQWKTCEDHPNTQDPATYSGIEIGNKIVKLTPEVKTQLLNGNAPFVSVGAFPFSELSSLIADQRLVPLETYEIVPEKFFAIPYSTLLDRLRVKRRIILAQIGKEKMQRYGVLTHSGLFITIHYEEEIRSRKFEPVAPDRKLARELNEELDALGDFPIPPSAGPIMTNLERWFTDIAMGRTIVAYTERVVVDA